MNRWARVALIAAGVLFVAYCGFRRTFELVVGEDELPDPEEPEA